MLKTCKDLFDLAKEDMSILYLDSEIFWRVVYHCVVEPVLSECFSTYFTNSEASEHFFKLLHPNV